MTETDRQTGAEKETDIDHEGITFTRLFGCVFFFFLFFFVCFFFGGGREREREREINECNHPLSR